MDVSENVGDRSRLVRVLFALGLGVVAIRWLRGGKRLRGLVAGIGAVALGASAAGDGGSAVDPLDETHEFDYDYESDASTDSGSDDDSVETIEIDTDSDVATDGAGLTCVACGDPIVPGQRRRPNADGETAHDSCL